MFLLSATESVKSSSIIADAINNSLPNMFSPFTYMLLAFLFIAIIVFAIIILIYLIIKKPSQGNSSKSNTNKAEFNQLTENVITEKPTEIIEEIKKDSLPYYKVNSVFNNKEGKFYASLKRIADEFDLTIFSKMRIADLVQVPKDTPHYIRWFNYIKAKHVDFILVDKAFKPVLIIEVDDASHNQQKRIERDDFVDKVFGHVGLKIMHLRLWKDDELRIQIMNAVGIKEEIQEPVINEVKQGV